MEDPAHSRPLTPLAQGAERTRTLLWTAGLSSLGALAAALPPVSVPAVVLTLIGGLSFPTPTGRLPRIGKIAIAVATLGATVGLFRFATQAMRGMVEGGQSVAATSALYKLREIVLAEDAMRRTGAWDPDGDHVGSAGLVGTLAGRTPPYGASAPLVPVLSNAYGDFVETPAGPAVRVEGYLYVVCLPTRGGGFSARPGDDIDDELAERRFLVYAWPADTGKGMNVAFFGDEHERIRVLEPPLGAPAPYFGAGRPPTCEAALSEPEKWKPWKNKAPRQTLPGDG